MNRPKDTPVTPAEVLEFRQLRGWTQKEAAEWWPCSERQWQRFESGESVTPPPLARRIRSRLERLRANR